MKHSAENPYMHNDPEGALEENKNEDSPAVEQREKNEEANRVDTNAENEPVAENEEKRPDAEIAADQVEKIREELGLPPEENAQNEAEEKMTDKEKEVSDAEKEQLIAEEKERILQEMIGQVFEEFKKLAPEELQNIVQTGRTREGANVESGALGSLQPEVAQPLAQTFSVQGGEGETILSRVLQNLPELWEMFDTRITEEATKRVEERVRNAQETAESEQEEMSENDTETEESETPENQEDQENQEDKELPRGR